MSSRAWAELVHAQVGVLLAEAGLPCLHIKGPTVATWLYDEGERSWGDIDILLPPSAMDAALDVLLSSTFSLRDEGLRWRTSEDHALTLWHDPHHDATYGNGELDVHHRFPGIDADPELAFAELWRRREPHRLAGYDVWFPDLPSRALLLVLNAARDPYGAKPREDLRRLLAGASADDWRRTIDLARRLRALDALRAGVELEPESQDLVASTALADVEVSAAWRLRTSGSTRTAVRLEELRRLGPLAKARAVAGWVVPSPAIIRMRDPRAADSAWALARGYATRYRQGVRELRHWVRERRS
ncbi:nucleotidyltransferase family protein [Nocardioides islandensis]|uniref:Nucleotidyltransferase family protein n=1 Tax=Nocardioides islandensis TaxID=433663 RepID=A0A930YG07_9ACTN|nr:nucleotidyltransferase family protein [Nocardioides islandensis]MBF4765403.1 nucleotidyltransferase family protein [Nocardioides islandensis]